MQAWRMLGMVTWTAMGAACSSSATHALPDAVVVDAAPDLMTDVHNCGAIGHACGCGSTSCTHGVCDSHTLADNQNGPMVLALHNGILYWGNDSAQNVSTVPIDGSAAARVLFPNRTVVRGFAFDATRIYFTRNTFNIVEVNDLDGTSLGNLTNQQEPGAAGMAADATNVYWADGGNGTLRRAALGAPVQAPTTLESGEMAPSGVALDANNVYWTTHATDGQVLALAKTAPLGTLPTVLADHQVDPRRIAVADGFVYWTSQGDGLHPNIGTVQRVAVTGGAVTTLAGQLPAPDSLAISNGFVYWTDPGANAVMRMPVDGSAAPSLVAAGTDGPNGLAVTDTCVYFTDVAGLVRSHDLQ